MNQRIPAAFVALAVVVCALPTAAQTGRGGRAPVVTDNAALRTLIAEVAQLGGGGGGGGRGGGGGTPVPLPAGTDPRYTPQLSFTEPDAIHAGAARAQVLLDRVKALQPSLTTTEDQLDAYILRDRLERQVADAAFRTYLVPISDASGFHTQFAGDVATRQFATVAHYDAYIARLLSFRELTRRQIALMREGLKIGHTLPGPSMLPDYASTIRAHIADTPEATAFHAPLTRIPAAIGGADRDRILRDGTAAIRESVLPAYREFLAFMESEYLPNVRSEVGLSAVPGGREYYEHLVRHYTTLDLTAKDVHGIGLKEVARLRGEMQTVIDQVQFKGSFADFLHFLRTDPRFYVTDPQQYLKEAALITMRMQGQLPALFRTLPETPLGLRPFPDTPAALRGTGASYAPGQHGARAGFYNLNLSAISSRPLYILEALSFHEGVPGHHLQIMLHNENQTITDLRRQGGGVTAFSEGWALYSERLGLDVGFYQDPYSNFGRLTYEIWRACRLVVDTGMHAFGWSRQQAIDYMVANTALSVHEVTTEVDRYIRSRGQALAYKMGELKISELRRRAEAALGAKFDLRDFHDAVLKNGAIPLPFLERQVDAWIKEAAGR